jgi:hypothetical protein
MRLRDVWINSPYLMSLAFATSVLACGGNKETPSTSAGTPAPPGGGQKVDAATAGDLKGAITLEGTAPKNEPIKMNADPVCLKENKTPQFQETYSVGSDGKSLSNVFVYVKDGLGNYVFDPPTDTVTIDQRECRYHPHVFGLRVGQKLIVLNSDPTLHNIHALPKVNSEYNVAEPIQGMKQEHVFTTKEVMVPFKCEVHGWMNAYAGVLDHPYYGVSDKDGKFEIKSLPPGTYTIEAWHEKLGTMTQSVTLGPKDTKDVNFTFKAGATTTNN